MSLKQHVCLWVQEIISEHSGKVLSKLPSVPLIEHSSKVTWTLLVFSKHEQKMLLIHNRWDVSENILVFEYFFKCNCFFPDSFKSSFEVPLSYVKCNI